MNSPIQFKGLYCKWKIMFTYLKRKKESKFSLNLNVHALFFFFGCTTESEES